MKTEELRLYVPKEGDRVRVRPEALVRLGVPRAVGGSGATVVDVDDRFRPIVRLDAVPWATPADAGGGGGVAARSDGWELLPRDVWPAALLPPSPHEEELLEVFWTLRDALGVRRFSRARGHPARELAVLLAEEVAVLRRRVAALEGAEAAVPFDDSDGVDDLNLPPPDDDGSVPP